MAKSFSENLQIVADPAVQPSLRELQRGIEKEGLRTTETGKLAPTPHPRSLGSALTNPWITTDFSENLLEFITPVFHSIEETLQCLENIHRYTYQNLDGEFIWASSMPCILPDDDDIPLAQYGSSNIGKMKTAYRRGLGHRYGRAMQTVAGIHYNFSLPENFWIAMQEKANHAGQLQDFITDEYLGLIRNFRRNYWLLVYLFGAAPAVDKSFVQGRQHQLLNLGNDSLYTDEVTSLRMGDLGYQSKAQQSLFVCYNELSTYIATLGQAIQTPYPEYERFGLNVDGEYQQLSTALLQIENEFYSPIRPKRTTASGEKPLAALDSRGIEYVEIRCMDLDPFEPAGISEDTVRFLDCFLLYCLLKESSQCDREEFDLVAENQSRIVNHGLDPEITVFCGKQELPMRRCASNMLNDIEAVAQCLDAAHSGESSRNKYSESVALQREKIADPDLTPAAKIKQAMRAFDNSHVQFSLHQTREFADYFRKQPLDGETDTKMSQASEDSLAQQRTIEENDTIGFDEFLRDYYSH